MHYLCLCMYKWEKNKLKPAIYSSPSFSVLASLPVSPPVLGVPPGGQVVSVREGGNVDLVCLVVDGKPRPPILWSRTEKDLLMPGGKTMIETPDGRLRLKNVSRDMMGLYRCQTAPYNGLNIKRRETQVQLKVQCKCLSYYAPTQPTVTYNTIIWIKAWLLVERTCAISCNAVWCKEDWLWLLSKNIIAASSLLLTSDRKIQNSKDLMICITLLYIKVVNKCKHNKCRFARQ